MQSIEIIDLFFEQKQNKKIPLPRAIKLKDNCKLLCYYVGEQNTTANIAIPTTIEKQHSIIIFEVDSRSQTVNFKIAGILPAGNVPNFWFQIPFKKLIKILNWKYSE